MSEISPHILPLRIYYEDTDAGGIVYHANYLKFAERGRTELLRSLGYDHGRVAAEFDGLLLVVRHVEMDFLAPARLDDRLQVETAVAAFGNTSLTMSQTVRLESGVVLATLTVVVVAVSPKGRPVRLPPQLRQIFADKSSQK